MILKIVDFNFTREYDWTFKLSDKDGNEIYVMDKSFYERNGIPDPIGRKEIDSLDRGDKLDCDISFLEDRPVVIKIHSY